MLSAFPNLHLLAKLDSVHSPSNAISECMSKSWRREGRWPFLFCVVVSTAKVRVVPTLVLIRKMTRLAKWEAAYLTTWQVPHMEVSTRY